MKKCSVPAMYLLVGLCAASFTGLARDLVWLGTPSNADWDLKTANWCLKGDSSKTRICFQEGDNAFFFEDMWETNATRLIRTNTSSWQKEFDIGAIVISNETQTFSWSCNGRAYVDAQCFTAQSIDKFGKGDFSVAYGFQWDCPFTMHGGRFLSGYKADYTTDSRNPVGSMVVARTVSFLAGSTWAAVANSRGFGAAGNAGIIANERHVHVVFSNATINTSENRGDYVNFPKLSLYNTTWVHGDGEGIWEPNRALIFSGDLAIGGTTPMEIEKRLVVFGKRDGSPIEINVSDVTRDEGADLVFKVPISTATIRVGGKDTPYEGCSGFVKTGAGTMELTDFNSDFTGDVVVSGGTVRVVATPWEINWNRSPLGKVGIERTVTVCGDGVLQLGSLERDGNMELGNPNTPASFAIAVEPGGTLRLANGAHMIGALELNGGDFEYGKGDLKSWIDYGLLTIGKKLAFSGTTPYDLNVRGETGNVLYLGFTHDSEKDEGATIPENNPNLTNLWSVVEIAVADITKSEAVDASIGLPMRDLVNICYPGYASQTPNDYAKAPYAWARFRDGIRKTGEGTLRLYAQNGYSHVTEVAEGTLRVDGSIASSSGVTVDAAAFLGGTGVVSAVTLKAGGGFAVDGLNARADVLSVSSLTCEGAVVVRLENVTEASVKQLRQGVCRIADKPKAVDFTNWTVACAHAKPKKFRFDYDPATGVVDVVYAPPGLMMVIR